MSASILEVLPAAAFFVAGHFIFSSLAVRTPIESRIGEWPYRGLYSIIAIAALVWLAVAYSRAPMQELWPDHFLARVVALVLMFLASILLVAGLTAPNPTMIGAPFSDGRDPGRGVFAVTRHPLMWAVALWALAHLLANGDVASVILFGSILILALGGMAHIDARRRAAGGEAWDRLEATTSALPFAALLAGRATWAACRFAWWRLALGAGLYIALILAHGPVIGLSPLPV